MCCLSDPCPAWKLGSGQAWAVGPRSVCPPHHAVCRSARPQLLLASSALIPSFSGRTAGRRHTGMPPTVPQQRCFLLSFSARGTRLRGPAPGYRLMFKALFKPQDLT